MLETTAKAALLAAENKRRDAHRANTDRHDSDRFSSFPSRRGNADMSFHWEHDMIETDHNGVEKAWEPHLAYIRTVQELLPLLRAGEISAAAVAQAGMKARDDEKHEQREDLRTASRNAATDRLASATEKAGRLIQDGLYAVANAIAMGGAMAAHEARLDRNQRRGAPTGSGL